MKKRINGRKYNTDTAIYVGQYTLDTDQAWNAYTETLYYKRNGEFFLFRHGGRREDFQENQNPPVNPEWPIQIEFEPLTFEQAKEWVLETFRDVPTVTEYVQGVNFDWTTIQERVINWAINGIGGSGLLSSTVSVIGAVTGQIANIFISLIFALFLLSS